MEADPRLAEAMYLAQVQAGAEALSGVYAVLGRRRSRILSEEVSQSVSQSPGPFVYATVSQSVSQSWVHHLFIMRPTVIVE